MTPGSISDTGMNRVKAQICSEARALLERYSETVSQTLLLHEAQFHAVVGSDADSHRFDLLIHEANARKSRAKYAYLGHLRDHGCSGEDFNRALKSPAGQSA
jgi:hypothetical protein